MAKAGGCIGRSLSSLICTPVEQMFYLSSWVFFGLGFFWGGVGEEGPLFSCAFISQDSDQDLLSVAPSLFFFLGSLF